MGARPRRQCRARHRLCKPGTDDRDLRCARPRPGPHRRDRTIGELHVRCIRHRRHHPGHRRPRHTADQHGHRRATRIVNRLGEAAQFRYDALGRLTMASNAAALSRSATTSTTAASASPTAPQHRRSGSRSRTRWTAGSRGARSVASTCSRCRSRSAACRETVRQTMRDCLVVPVMIGFTVSWIVRTVIAQSKLRIQSNYQIYAFEAVFVAWRYPDAVCMRAGRKPADIAGERGHTRGCPDHIPGYRRGLLILCGQSLGLGHGGHATDSEHADQDHASRSSSAFLNT